MSNEYKAALDKANAASLVFFEAKRAYRARETDDAAMVAAHAAHNAAVAEFDAACEKETN